MRSLTFLLGLTLASSGAIAQVTIKATNPIQLARPNQTIEIAAKDLPEPGARQDLSFIHIKDSAGKEILAQAVDTDFDEFHKPDSVIFQADFGPGESKTFTASLGGKLTYEEEQFKAHGRFVRERFDDFCWENDRIAHRTYGKGLETWKGEPLTSSTIDIWSKRTPKMVIDKWYMVDDYHADHGEGYDDYSAGQSRGDGGIGLWANNQLYVSKNFVASRVLTNGPIRVMFELDYEAFDVNGTMVSETKRVSLDGGSNMDHYQSMFKVVSGQGPLVAGIGLKKAAGEQKEYSAEHGWLIKWERMEKNGGMQGLGIAIDPKLITQQTEDRTNQLILAKVGADNAISYYAGFCWDKGGQFSDMAGWKKYMDEFSQGMAAPIQVTVSK